MNNYGKINKYGKPSVIEFTFTKNKYCDKIKNSYSFPDKKIDFPNNPNFQDKKVIFS